VWHGEPFGFPVGVIPGLAVGLSGEHCRRGVIGAKEPLRFRSSGWGLESGAAMNGLYDVKLMPKMSNLALNVNCAH